MLSNRLTRTCTTSWRIRCWHSVKTSSVVLGYTHSDEISLILQDYFRLDTESAFGKRLQKIVSIAASLATAVFNDRARQMFAHAPLALFDARALVLPKEEVTNYLTWRQNDAVRNSIRMAGYTYFSHKALERLSKDALQERLWLEHGIITGIIMWYGKSAGVAPFVTPRLAVGGSMKNRPFLRKIARTSCTDWNRIHLNKPRGVVW